jgi:taurine dioxygenase
VTGKKALFVSPSFTASVVGLDDVESRRLLRTLFDIQQRPEYQCRLHWQPGTVAMWDNRCTQHHAIWDYFPSVRHGQRVTVEGERPV